MGDKQLLMLASEKKLLVDALVSLSTTLEVKKDCTVAGFLNGTG